MGGLKRRRRKGGWAVSPEAASFSYFLRLSWLSPVSPGCIGGSSVIRQSCTVFIGWRRRTQSRKRLRRFLNSPLPASKSKACKSGGRIFHRKSERTKQLKSS